MKTYNLSYIFSTVFILIINSFTADAQVRYTDGRFTIDSTPYSNYKMTVGGNGAYFMDSNVHFFQIDVSQDNARLAGHGDQVVFYNSATNKYNSISVLNVYYHSDARAKTDIRTFTNGLEIVAQLRPVTYNFINEGNDYRRGSQQEIGLLAQEVESILPGAVIADESGSKLINYNALIPVLIDAIKTLQAEVEDLKTRK
ncbi:tail fiber domain-containing protein [uncultured Alistipes sp.]|uniref:tail fiber domain-containing protein n=1 Tax=uncultured Alistipes sp. TaxID=538949 RepID=UPI00262C678F|nr:tail fiber domain-containing protein [uncultured Alistipes sp.]